MRTIIAHAIAFLVLLVVASCAVSASAASGDVSVTSLLDVIRPYVVEVGSVLILAFVTWLSSWLRATFKVNLDEAHRKSLHSALENGARLALEKLGTAVEDKSVAISNPTVAIGIEYVLKYSPDAVAYFGLTPERVSEMLRAKLVSAG